MDENSAPLIAPVTDTFALSPDQHPLKPGILEAISAWKEKRRAEIHRKVAANSARESREKYRAEREAQGKTVRPYKFHIHLSRQEGETESDYRKRIHRDRQRIYRGAVSAQPKSPRADLSTMTPEERADHTRKLAAARKQRERDRKKGAVSVKNFEAPSSVDRIEWGMF